MPKDDKTLENLLILDDTRFVIDEIYGLWVKFEAKRVKPTSDRPQGIKYSLTLHDRKNTRILGFDNAHAIDDSHNTFDHYHQDGKDCSRPYTYVNAGKLLEDFWKRVDMIVKELEEDKHD